MKEQNGKRVAIITENGFEESELTSPKKRLEAEGITVDILSSQKNKSVKAWNHDHWSIELPVDRNIEEASVNDYDALVIPGGVLNPDKMRVQSAFVDFTKTFLESGKPVASICHGPQLLIETGMLKGKELTSYPSVQTDLKNAGGNWVDKEVAVDGNLITSRSPKDLDAFNDKLIEMVGKQVHTNF
ncbi:MAG: type 1 glutamine amidotransferase domain-containing protein [Ginsengibacter sp.]